MKEFFVGQFRVDMGRSEIVAQDAIVSMEPRVLQVLLILAKHQGEVVSHQQILDDVWKDIKVAPNTLQRCITQLRKALGDNAKTQSIIKTHPKVGYSLIANVSWQSQLSNVGQHSESSSRDQQLKVQMVSTKPRTTLILSGVGLAVVALLFVVIGPLLESGSSLPLDKLTALTTTDKKEFSPSYSPDGRYIAFQRYVGLCENEIWAKDLEQNREYLLTRESGIYGTPSWSPNGQNIAFSNITHCSMTREFQGCKDLRVLSFALAKSEPQETSILVPCDQQDYSAAVWMNNDQVAFIESLGRHQQVKKMTVSTGEIEPVYKGDSVLFDSLSYSSTLKQLAVTQHNLARQSSMVLIDEISGKHREVTLNPPGSFRAIASWYFNWHPTEPKLITARGNTIFEIDLQGQFKEYPIPTMQSINDPFFHPSGERVIASMGIFDKDAHILQWQTDATGVSHYQLTNIHRSIVSEYSPQFAPNGRRLAFVSHTSGSQQIWITELDDEGLNTSGEPIQVSNLTNNEQIYAMAWSHDSHLLIALIDGQLHLLNLDGQLTKLETGFRVVDIYQAPSENKVLLEVSEPTTEKIILLDLKTMKSNTLYQGDVRWGQLSESGVLYFSDLDDTIHRVVDGNALPITQLQDLFISSVFHLSQNQLILTGRDNTIWQYNLTNQTKRKLFRVHEVLKRVDQADVGTNRLLLTTVASTSKEIVEFHR